MELENKNKQNVQKSNSSEKLMSSLGEMFPMSSKLIKWTNLRMKKIQNLPKILLLQKLLEGV